MSKWTNKFSIMRDLSSAQGSVIPFDLDDTVGAKEKPRKLYLNEDAEEEYYLKDYEGGNVHIAPDLGGIQNMLNMVRQGDTDSDSDNNLDAIQFLKPKAHCLNKAHNAIDLKESRQKARRERNVALMSILNKDSDCSTSNEPLKSNFIYNNNSKGIPEAITFKKKMVKRPVSNAINVSVQKSTHVSNNCPAYEPSPLAAEYYTQYLERSQLTEEIQCSIWTKVEYAIKDLDAKKVLAESAVKEEGVPETSLLDNDQGTEGHRLSNHRHLLSETCIVCDVIKKTYPNLKSD